MGHPAPALSFQASYSFGTTMEDHSFFSTKPVMSSRVEIVCIEEGAGVFITGNDRTPFKSGDVILAGTHLCHQYKLDGVYDGEERSKVKVTVVRFLPDFWGETFLNLQENGHIKVLLDKANQGVMPDGETCGVIRGLLERMLYAEGTGKIILLLEVLYKMSVSSGLRLLSSGEGVSHYEEPGRMERVYQYSRANFYRKIDLGEIAAVAYVSPNSFCRWFKSRARKTYSRFLIELRVRHACQLLIESRLCAKKICIESGFNNFSNFHKCFKEVTGKSPVEYQRAYRSAGEILFSE